LKNFASGHYVVGICNLEEDVEDGIMPGDETCLVVELLK